MPQNRLSAGLAVSAILCLGIVLLAWGQATAAPLTAGQQFEAPVACLLKVAPLIAERVAWLPGRATEQLSPYRRLDRAACHLPCPGVLRNAESSEDS